MMMVGRKFSASGSYRFGFNGKEIDGIIFSNNYDFGARVYDSRIGKFFSVDFFATPKTPYAFAGNDPINYIDFNGNFKISPFFVKRYPTLAKMLEIVLPSLIMNEQMMERWITNIGFTSRADGVNAWKEMLTFGSGPWVTPNRPMSEFNDYLNQALAAFFGEQGGGEYEKLYPHNITIGWEVLDNLETALKNGNGKEIGYQAFIVMMQVMHEGGHWARHMKVKEPSRTDYCFEDGAMAEEAVTDGIRFSYGNCRYADMSSNAFDYQKSKDYYNKSYNLNISLENRQRNQGAFIPNTGTCMGTGTLKVRIPTGQNGDPTLADNGDDEPVIFSQDNANDNGTKRRTSNNTTYDY